MHYSYKHFALALSLILACSLTFCSCSSVSEKNKALSSEGEGVEQSAEQAERKGSQQTQADNVIEPATTVGAADEAEAIEANGKADNTSDLSSTSKIAQDGDLLVEFPSSASEANSQTRYRSGDDEPLPVDNGSPDVEDEQTMVVEEGAPGEEGEIVGPIVW